MSLDYIIVQAGGKGTRLKQLTKNKPKALVPIGSRPMLFHLFEKFPDKKFIVIADYKKDVMKKYLAVFANVNYLVVDANGDGTCAGVREAISMIPEHSSFMLIWSDLVLADDFEIPTLEKNFVGLAGNFVCRWKYENGLFEEDPSDKFGVAGFFIFQDKKTISDVPQSGEFVKWLKSKDIDFDTVTLNRTKEYGLIKVWEDDNLADGRLENRCRPFNKLTVQSDKIIKEGIDSQGKSLAIREKNWYKHIDKCNFKFVPKIYSFEPFTMEKVDGKNVFEYEFDLSKKKLVIDRIISALNQIHSFGEMPTDYFSIYEAYIGKTFKRLDKIRDLVPHANEKYITINGRRCRNVFFFKDELIERVKDIKCDKFTLLHGDNTFSNILLNKDLQPIFIDPRGYFGYTELYGDPLYDWAKLYYSIAGNYDQFNLKKFELTINDDSVDLNINSNGWEDVADYYLNSIEYNKNDIKLLHAIIWLSLTTYAWEDYDSICGAFYNGLYYLEEVL